MYAYIYSRKRYKRVLACLWAFWVVSFIVRIGLYLHFGPSVMFESGFRILAYLGIGTLGAIITMMIIKRRSAPVPKKSE